ncbi:trypsin-like peptidase domain-containing protein [Streptomyces sp. NPDC058739]|uniref:trypsin-like peptidase domain-containing protein n=1 Tax=Streptomyces sp. NPDC058739 TaxID=3346618 RepID=UPI0036B39ADE
MKKEQAVEVFAALDNGEWGCGSGYLVGPRLVLTAAHAIVVEVSGKRSFHTLSSSQDIRCRVTGDDTLFHGEVVWRGEGADLDVALVEITDGTWHKDRVAPVRWGRTTCQKSRVDCTAVGYPQVLRLSGQRREREHLSGRVNPAAGEKSGTYHVLVDDAPTRHMNDDSPWAGMSGAALFSEELLIGVVVIDHDGFDGHRLTAVRMSEVFADTEFLRHITEHCGAPGGVGKTKNFPVLESAELATLFSGRRPLRRPRTPATLLTAQVAAVRWFHGREGRVAELQDWLASPEPLEARLVVGPGGYGKTRLAAELHQRALAMGWITGMVQADQADRLPIEPMARLGSCELPLLLIVDYAETRPDVVQHLLRTVSTEAGHTVRLLMLARSPGKWWESLWGSTWQLQEAVALDGVEVLGPLPEDCEHRGEAFREAALDLAQALPKVRGLDEVDWTALAERITVPDLSRSRYGSIMQIHLAALVSLLQSGPTSVATANNGIITHEDLLITHEKPYWRAGAQRHGVALGDDSLTNAVTVATLMGAADRDEALAVLARVRGLDGQSEGQLMDVDQWLTTLYPPSGTGRWGALEPDRLGEHLVGVQLRDWPDLLVKPLAAATLPQLHRAFHVLARASVDHSAAREALRFQVVEQLRRTGPTALSVALETEVPEFLLELLEEGVQAALDDPDTLAALAEAFPVKAPELAILAEQVTRLETAVCRRLVSGGLSRYLPQLAGATRRHAEQLHALGRTEEALVVQSEAVSLYGDLLDNAELTGRPSS